jgi:hypothetical protein
MNFNEKEQAIDSQRIQSWRDFLVAVDAGLRGEWGVCTAYVDKHPHNKDQLRAFIRACKTGRLQRKDGGGWAEVKTTRTKAAGKESANA